MKRAAAGGVPACLLAWRGYVCARARREVDAHSAAQHSPPLAGRQTGDIALRTPARLDGRSVVGFALAVGRWRLCRGRGKKQLPPQPGQETLELNKHLSIGFEDARIGRSCQRRTPRLRLPPLHAPASGGGAATAAEHICGGESFIQTRPRIYTARCGSRPLVSLE